MSKTALILGSTGQVGGYLLKELLASPHYSRVGEYGRRVTDLSLLPEAGKEKLEQKKIDFEKLSESGLKDGKWDVVYISLGTSRKNAGSAENFIKIDREYVLSAAAEARVKDHDQRLVYVSSIGANSSSPFLYTKSKGLTEEGLAKIGYNDTIIFRPALLAGTARPEFRLGETAFSYVTGLLSTVSDNMQIKVATLAKSLVYAGNAGSAGLPASAHATKAGPADAQFTLIANAGALALAKLAETSK